MDYALLVADQGLKVFPVVPLGKSPAVDEWQSVATTDPLTITQWFRERPRLNYGIVGGLENGVFMTDLDGEDAIRWFTSKGFPLDAIVETPSGGRHYYYRVYDVEIQTNKSKVYPKVDIRGEGGYVVGPGSITPQGSYRGNLAFIPDAPAELLELIPERQAYTYEVPDEDLEKTTEVSPREAASLDAIVESLQALPEVWAPGVGWHDTVMRAAHWLSRMVNSPHYATTEAGAIDILLNSTPTYPDWGTDNILREWAAARVGTVGQYAERPAEAIPNLLPFMEIANLPNFPAITSSGHSMLNDLIFEWPEDATPANSWRYRRTILIECLKAGLTDEQAVSIAWEAKVSTELMADPHGLRALWNELDRAKTAMANESGEGIEPPPASERPALATASVVEFLTSTERMQVDQCEWWGSRYVEWTESRVSKMNPPYHRMNRWTILSLRFSPYGFIPKKKGPLGLNLFQFVLGKTTTGKTESLELMDSVIRFAFPGDSPDIGGNASPNSLIEKLIERNGKPSWFNADEAHGLFKEMAAATWREGLRELWTKLYEGRVPMILRNGKRDLSGVDARTHFVMHLMGTTDGMSSVLDEEFWTSGFLARFVWAIGLEFEWSPDDYTEDQQEGDVVKFYEAMPKQWAAEFDNAVRKLGSTPEHPRPMLMTQEALARHTAFKKAMGEAIRGHRQEELLKPTTIRFANSIRKCATLVAMVESSPVVTLEHELIALEQAEEWFANIMTMVEASTSSAFARQVDDLERFIAGQRNRQVKRERIYSHLRIEKYFTDKLIAQLVAEGRIAVEPAVGGGEMVRIKEGLVIAA